MTRKGHEISPCASLSRDDRGGMRSLHALRLVEMTEGREVGMT